MSQNFRCRVTSVQRRLTADIIGRMERTRALVHCHGVCGIRVPGQLASVHRCVHFDSELGTKKNCKFRLRIHNLQLHKSRSQRAASAACAASAIPSGQDGLLGISRQPILSARRRRRERKRRDGAASLHLACDTLTRRQPGSFLERLLRF